MKPSLCVVAFMLAFATVGAGWPALAANQAVLANLLEAFMKATAKATDARLNWQTTVSTVRIKQALLGQARDGAILAKTEAGRALAKVDGARKALATEKSDANAAALASTQAKSDSASAALKAAMEQLQRAQQDLEAARAAMAKAQAAMADARQGQIRTGQAFLKAKGNSVSHRAGDMRDHERTSPTARFHDRPVLSRFRSPLWMTGRAFRRSVVSRRI